jgi:hypothetical protein
MRPDMVVEKQKLIKRALQHPGIFNLPTVKRLLQSPEEPLDLSVHPRATDSGEPLTDTEKPKHCPEQNGLKNSLIIGLQRPWLPITPNRKKQIPEQRPRTLA